MGDVARFGFAAMARKVLYCGGYVSFGEDAADFRVGMFPSPLASWTAAPVSVVRYLISAHASSVCCELWFIPTSAAELVPPPYALVALASVGNGAVPYCSEGVWLWMKAVRHSPSISIATWPVWKAFFADHSSPSPAVKVFSLA